jgi:hypothetical protein
VFAFEVGNVITGTQRAVALRSNGFYIGGPGKGKYLALDDPIQISILLLARQKQINGGRTIIRVAITQFDFEGGQTNKFVLVRAEDK